MNPVANTFCPACGERRDTAGLCQCPSVLLAEVERLQTENAKLRADLLAAAERIAGQKELLEKRAEGRRIVGGVPGWSND